MNPSLPTRAFREHTDLDQLKRQAKELLEAFRRADPEAVKEVRPLLAAQGHVVAPAPTRFRTAADLLAFVAAVELFSAAGNGAD